MKRKMLLRSAVISAIFAGVLPLSAQSADPFDDFAAPAETAPPAYVPSAPAHDPAAPTPEARPEPAAGEIAAPTPEASSAAAPAQEAAPAPAEVPPPAAILAEESAATTTDAPLSAIETAMRSLAEARSAMERGDAEFAAYLIAQYAYTAQLINYEMQTGVRSPDADAALTSAFAALESAWAAIDSALALEGLPPQLTPPADTAAIAAAPTPPADTAAVAAAPIVTPPAAIPTPAEHRAVMTAPLRIAAGMGFAPAVFGSDKPNFRPWWNFGFHGSYREADTERALNKGLGIDVSLYMFDRKAYDRYHESLGERGDIQLFNIRPLFLVDIGYHGKWYPAEISGHRIPYFIGSAGIGGTLGGSAVTSYNTLDTLGNTVGVRTQNEAENLVNDTYIVNASVGFGVDIPIPAGSYSGVKFFFDIQYTLRLGLQSIMVFEDEKIQMGGLTQQMPIRFGVAVPFKTSLER